MPDSLSLRGKVAHSTNSLSHRPAYKLQTSHVVSTSGRPYVCTVTCRQFPNLTFAPRKNLPQRGSNLTLHSYHATARLIIHDVFGKCKHFFTILLFLQNFCNNSLLFTRPLCFLSFYYKINANTYWNAFDTGS